MANYKMAMLGVPGSVAVRMVSGDGTKFFGYESTGILPPRDLLVWNAADVSHAAPIPAATLVPLPAGWDRVFEIDASNHTGTKIALRLSKDVGGIYGMFIWDSTTGWQQLTTLSATSQGNPVTFFNAGVIGSQFTGGFNRPYSWTFAGVATALTGFTASFSFYPYGCSADGTTVIGGRGQGTTERAFRWDSGTLTLLPHLGLTTFTSNASSVTADGAVAFGYVRDTASGFIHVASWNGTANATLLLQTIMANTTLPSGRYQRALCNSAGTRVRARYSNTGANGVWYENGVWEYEGDKVFAQDAISDDNTRGVSIGNFHVLPHVMTIGVPVTGLSGVNNEDEERTFKLEIPDYVNLPVTVTTSGGSGSCILCAGVALDWPYDVVGDYGDSVEKSIQLPTGGTWYILLTPTGYAPQSYTGVTLLATEGPPGEFWTGMRNCEENLE